MQYVIKYIALSFSALVDLMHERMSMVSRLFVFVGVMATIAGCMRATPAERCIYVDLEGKRGRELIPLLDFFAVSQDLESDKSHPVNPNYARKSEGGKLEAEVSYTIGMGPFGAELSLFRYDDDKNADLLLQFDTFVFQSIAPKYKVTPCAPSQFPTTYR